MFLRRHYYDRATGATIESGMRQGAIVITTHEHDYAAMPSLAGRTDADTGCFEWREVDPVIEELFATMIVGVDITQTPPALVWTDPPVEPDETEATV